MIITCAAAADAAAAAHLEENAMQQGEQEQIRNVALHVGVLHQARR